MFVRTQFNTIVNLAEFDKVKLELDVKQDSGDVLHIISAVSEEYSYRLKAGEGVNVAGEIPVRTHKIEVLAKYKEDWKDLANRRYDELYSALSHGKPVFHIAPFSGESMKGKD